MNTQRTLTALEIELISIVKMQSAKLLEAADYVAHIGGVTEAIRDFRESANVNVYLEQYSIVPDQITLADLKSLTNMA